MTMQLPPISETITRTEAIAIACWHQEKADNVQPGKWHCFDIPFVLKCENMEMAKTINDYLAPLSNDMKDKLQIAIQQL